MENERFIVNKDPQNCEGCYFLNKDNIRVSGEYNGKVWETKGFLPSYCLRLAQPIYLIDSCLTGPMIQRPKTIDEIIQLGNTLLAEKRATK